MGFPPQDPNQALLSFENPGDASIATTCTSSEKIDKNLSQNPVYSDTGDKNDTLPPTNGVIREQESVITKTIYRLGHSDTWACELCKLRGDKWFMRKHPCKGHN